MDPQASAEAEEVGDVVPGEEGPAAGPLPRPVGQPGHLQCGGALVPGLLGTLGDHLGQAAHVHSVVQLIYQVLGRQVLHAKKLGEPVCKVLLEW